ncbi:o-succinylbenzoate--CoA ligase [Peribacillus acanthi]|uniref:o-succinylbenzoate--CoA ligase n=1 Tax=Peribacillus acanthi TaxID=2171554 RepID=UPI000D3E99A7|nr:o-succinylbenzoate--CoA ligase [Peribacillus acanthi]
MPNWLKKRADLSPHRIALSFEKEEISFKQLFEGSQRVATVLYRMGISKKSRVALLGRNHIDSVFVFHALLQLGTEIVMLNNKLTVAELAYQIQDSNSECIISDNKFMEKVRSFKPILIDSILTEANRMDEIDAPILDEFEMNRTATIMYTSGTTGQPKGVMQTFGNHWWSAVGSVLNLGLREEDCWLCTVPIFHISGLSILFRSLFYGMKVLLHERFHEEKANEAIFQQGVTIASVVTSMLNRMLLEMGKQTYPSTFRCMLLGGGPAPLTVLETCKQKGIPVYQTYGMTETSSQIVTLPPEYSLAKLGSAGKPLFPCSIKIMNDEVEAVHGEAGEIAVKGPNVTKGYLFKEEATLKSVKDGWFLTGDIGYLDSEGFLYVLDRRSDLIISGGENIYPAEIENVLMQHSAIYEAGVTGIEDEIWGQTPVGFVVLHEGKKISSEELELFCRGKLAAYKVPKCFYFVNELPRNASNKLMRRNLRQLMDKGGSVD